MVREILEQQIANWEKLGVPALVERFVLRKGQAYRPVKRIGRKGVEKECYANAARYILKQDASGNGPPQYVEGFVVRRSLPVLIPHAWVTTSGFDAMDPTLDSSEFDYFGVPFQTKLLLAELARLHSFGLFDTGRGINTHLIFALDPQLQDICDRVVRNYHSLERRISP